MAFNLNQFITSGFSQSNLGNDDASLREAINSVLQNSEAIHIATGSSRPMDWANQALLVLNEPGDTISGPGENPQQISKYDEVRAWLAGDKQSHAKGNIVRRIPSNLQSLSSSIQNELSNIANIRDIPSTVSQAERANLEASALARETQLQGQIDLANSLGLNFPSPVRVASGFVPSGEAGALSGSTTLAPTREGEPTTIRQNAQGTYDIVGTTSGRVLAGGFADVQTALSNQNLRQAGSTPSVQTPINNVIDASRFVTGRGATVGGTTPVIPQTTTPQTGTSFLSNIPPIGQVSSFFQDIVSTPTSPFIANIQKAQQQIQSFQPTDISSLRSKLSATSGIDKILNELSNTDTQIAEIVGLQRRVPATTLQRAQGTEINQAILDRQRGIELQKLSDTLAPVTDLKKVLELDLARRQDLINQLVQDTKDSEAQKLQLLGTALDFATQNYKIASDQAESYFNAAIKDYELALNQAEKEANALSKAQEAQSKAIQDFYKAQGYVIDPRTGDLVADLELKRFLKEKTSGTGGTITGTSSLIKAVEAVAMGMPLSGISQTQKNPTIKQQVVQALSDIARTGTYPGFTGPIRVTKEQAQAALNRISGTEESDTSNESLAD